MHLIGALVSGIRGAENGSILLYKRGTSSPATWYASFEGAGANATGASITLDANGGAEVYVDELTDVIVRDSAGATVRAFTAGDSSPPVEVRSQSFNGFSYETAAGAAGNPTTLQAVLDLWLTKNGAVDWQIGFNGGTATIKAVASMLNGKLFYNVKDDAYGATGNGSTDDTAAIQLAINAAQSAGGGIVVFPEGTYKISSELSIGTSVSLWGLVGSGVTTGVIIETNSATAHVLRFADTTPKEIRNLTLRASVSNSGALAIVATGINPSAYFYNCVFGSSNNTGDLVRGHGMTFQDCLFFITPSSNHRVFNQVDVGDMMAFERCTFSLVAAGAYTPADGVINSKNLTLLSCTFIMGAMSGGTAFMVDCENSTYCFAIGNRVTAPAGGTVRLFFLGAVTAAMQIFEDFNVAQGSEASTAVALYNMTSVTGAAASFWQAFWLGSRERNSINIADDSANLDLSALQYALIINDRNNTTAQTITADAVIPNGSLTLITKNGNAGSLTNNITMDASDFRPSDVFTIAGAGNYDIRRWRGADADATVRWFADSAPRNNV